MSSEIENEVLTELKYVARPLMELGLYDSTREFIIDITREFIEHRIELYKKQLKAFEEKCGMPFEAFQRNWKMAHQSQRKMNGCGTCRNNENEQHKKHCYE